MTSSSKKSLLTEIGEDKSVFIYYKLNSNQIKFWRNVISTHKVEEELQNNIWPKIKTEKDEFISEEFEKNKTFMDTLIRYSEIKNILDENMDNDNNINKNKFFQMLVQLCEYDEMRNISNYIFNAINNDYLL